MPDKIVQLPSGERIQFPDSMADADINAAITNYLGSKQTGAMQSKPGGPVFSSKLAQPQPQDAGPSIGDVARAGARGATTAILPESSQSTDWKQNLATIGHGLNEQVNRAATTPWTQGGPIYGVAEMIGKGLMNALHGAASGAEEMGSGMWNVDPQKAAHGGGAFLGNLATLGLLKKTPEAISDPIGKSGLREVMGEGPSKANVLGDLHAHAIETQKHIAGVADAVHTDAQQAMARVSQAVDAAKPEGAFDKGEVGARLKTAMGDTLSDTSQLPKSVQKLMPVETSGRQPGPNIGGKTLDLSKPEDMAAYQKYKDSGAFTPEEIAKYEGKSTGMMSFEELKQARSDLGRQMGRLQGPAQAASSAAYAELSKILREGARDNGMEPDWIDANARYKNYIDDFQRSPLSKTLEGENASDIMDPLTGKSRAQVMGILGKYTPFGMNMERIGQEVNRSGLGDTVTKLSRPTKMDLLMAGFSPKALAVRQLGPRIFRNPTVLSWVAGEGFEPKNIPPEKIFPSKVAAAKALKTPGGPKGGINASGYEASLRPIDKMQQISSLSNEIDTMKAKLRGAGSASAADKAALESQIKDYQERLKELRGSD